MVSALVAERSAWSSLLASPWTGARRVLSMCAGLCALALASPSAGETWSNRSQAVLIGSSSFTQPFGAIIERELTRLGYEVTRKGVVGAGLARPDYRDMHQLLDSLPIGPQTAAVVVYLGVNDAQALWLHPHERGESGAATVPFASSDWDVLYLQRAQRFYERICQRGAARAIVLLPVDVNRPELHRNLERIRSLQVQAAAQTSCAATLSTAGDVDQFALPGAALRLPDGFHMSSRGAQVVWERVREGVMRLLDQPGAV